MSFVAKLPGACDFCRKRKIKCDSTNVGTACSRCVSGGRECTRNELGIKSKGYIERLESRLQKLEILLRDVLPGLDIENELQKIDSISSNNISLATSPVTLPSSISIQAPSLRAFLHIRPEFWGPKPWELSLLLKNSPVPYAFPDDDLLWELISLYFTDFNTIYPLLHKPNFQKNVKQKLHLIDYHFGGVVSLVCALAARFSTDERVKIPGYDPSAGWVWFEQVHVMQPPVGRKVSLYEIQAFILALWYIPAAGLANGWVPTGIGMRLWQDSPGPIGGSELDQELWKRAGWILYSMDQILASFSGRASSLKTEQLQIAYPLEVDDDFWDGNFERPKGQWHLTTFFIQFLKLMEFLGEILSTIYPVGGNKKSRLANNGKGSITDVMNKWLKSLPSFLRWSSSLSSSATVQTQSIYINAIYHHLLILSNRPFLPTVTTQSHLSQTSFDTSLSSAKAIIDMIRRMTISPGVLPPHMQLITFSAGLIFLMKVWKDRHASEEVIREGLDAVETCLDFLDKARIVWYRATKHWNLLLVLKNQAVEHCTAPLTQHSGTKRRYDDSDDLVLQELGDAPVQDVNVEADFADMFNIFDMFNSSAFGDMDFSSLFAQPDGSLTGGLWDEQTYEEYVRWEGTGS